MDASRSPEDGRLTLGSLSVGVALAQWPPSSLRLLSFCLRPGETPWLAIDGLSRSFTLSPLSPESCVLPPVAARPPA